MARQLQSEIGLNRHADVGGPSGIIVPRAFRHLLFEDIARGFDDPFRALLAEEGHEQHVFRFEDGVALKFADPMTIGPLLVEQAAQRTFRRGA